MSSYTDIVKYSATLFMEGGNHGRSKGYTGCVVLTTVLMLMVQAALVIYFNIVSDTSLFCGDVVRMIDDDNDDPKVLFGSDNVASFNTSWYPFG